MSNAVRERIRLTRARTSNDQERPRDRFVANAVFHGRTLSRIQVVQMRGG